jgi:hypothetical protein
MADSGGTCPDCGQTLAVGPGQTVPPHRPAGEQGTCSGTGKTAG